MNTLKKPTQSNLNVFRPSWSDLSTFRASSSGTTKETQAMNEKNQIMDQSRDAMNTLKLPDKTGGPADLTTNSTASHRSVNVGCGFSGQACHLF